MSFDDIEDRKKYFIQRLEEISTSEVDISSFFLVDDGRIKFEQGVEIGCRFAVAQMKDGMCWAIIQEKQLSPNKIGGRLDRYNHAVSITGLDFYSKRKIFVKLSQYIDKTNMFFSENQPQAYYYFIEDYSSSNSSSTINPDLYFSYSLANVTIKLGREITFIVNGQKIAYIVFKNKFSNKKRLNLSQLIVHNENLPDDWTVDNIADWICNLLSLALGRMIVIHHESDGITDTWYSKGLEGNSFTAFTEEKGRFKVSLEDATHKYGLSQESHSIRFVEQVLEFLFKSKFEDNFFYYEKIHDYVYYSAVAKEMKQRCTLLCALFEIVVDKWEKKNGGTKIDISDEKGLLSQIKREIVENWSTFLVREHDENESSYQQRQSDFLDGLEKAITNINPPSKKRIKRLFELCNWLDINILAPINTPSFWKKDLLTMRLELSDIGIKIRAMVDSRNKLFHEHRFVSDDPKKIPDENERQGKIDLEILNIQLFIPLLFATILGYKGEYWDSMQEKFMTIPR